MCGICGFVGDSKTSPANNETVIREMLGLIQHRGPDECGYLLHRQNALGNVRLSIVDLSSGQQPVADATGRYWIVYNGEVFNYPELRAQLKTKGVVFKTNCDTEVVLYNYLINGVDGLSLLNGQFAFAIYDTQEQSLFLARDRMGIRPLYYALKCGHFVFSSELKSFLACPDFDFKLSPKKMQQLFTFWNVKSNESVFEDISQVAPGCYLKWHKGAVAHGRYWRQPFVDNENVFKGSMDDAASELKTLLNDAIAIRLRADVPVAAYLSGGIDSSTTCQFINQLLPEGFHTFSLTFENPWFDESKYQSAMLNQLRSEHHATMFYEQDLEQNLAKTIWHAETPLLRTGPVPMMKLSELVRQNQIKVVITGEGADEVLGGYNIFKETLIRQFWARYPESKIRPMLLSRLYPYLPQFNNGNNKALQLFFGYKLSEVGHPAYSHLLRWRNGTGLCRLFNNKWLGDTNGGSVMDEYADAIADEVRNLSSLAKGQYIESDLFLPGYLLSSQGDRMAMANSVEGRYPFLDHRVVEFCHALPDDYKIRGLNEKYVLKRMMQSHLPAQIINRPKQAYRAPAANALLMSHALWDGVLSERALKESAIFDVDMVNRLLARIRNGDASNELDNMAINALLTTQLCHSLFCKRDNQPFHRELAIANVKRSVVS